MSAPQAIKVDAAAQMVGWRDGGEAVRAEVPGVFAARYDPGSDHIVALTGSGAAAVTLLSREGEVLARIEAPPGYSVSHFAEAGGATIVCQGEKPDGAWWDWHFTVDAEAGELRKAGPAY